MNIVLRSLYKFHIIVILLLFEFVSFPSKGYCLSEMQPIKIENDTFSIKISLGGNRRTGTLSQRVLTGSSKIDYKVQQWEFTNKVDYVFSNTNGIVVADDWFILSSTNYRFSPKSRITPYFFHEFRKNIQYKILHSHKVFLGVQMLPFEKRRNYSLYAGLGYESTRYNGDTFENTNRINNQRNFEIAVIQMKNNLHLFDERLLLGYSLFFVQSFRLSQDYTLGLKTNLNIPLKNGISLGVNYEFRLRNIHLVDTSRINDLLSFRLVLERLINK